MTDRELLELAAKAAGIEYIVSGPELWTTMNGSIHKWTERWNPLMQDAQAFRLAVELRLCVLWQDNKVIVHREDTVIRELLCNDPSGAVRRAIVRAAAEIGRTQ